MTIKNTHEGGCGQEDLLVSVLYDEATPDERAQFEAHRRECAACDQEFQAFGQVREQLHTWEVETVPPIRVEIKPSWIERLRRSFAIMPLAMRFATAGACALLLLAVFNTEIGYDRDGFRFRTSLVPSSAVQESTTAKGAEPSTQPAPISQEDLDRMITERCNQIVQTQMVAYRQELESQLDQLERQLVSSQSGADVKQLTVQVVSLKKKLKDVQRDLVRQAGYGGSDLLFSEVVRDPQTGS